MRILCLGDTHNRYDRFDPAEFPRCELMLFAGDITAGTASDVRAFDRWLGELPVEQVLLTPGNHDGVFEGDSSEVPSLEHGRPLLHEAVSVDGLSVFGSPYQPAFMDFAFNRPRGDPLRSLWEAIPADVEILLTHTPPAGVLDRPSRSEDGGVGCEALRERLDELAVRLHVFGHIHECYGVRRAAGTTFVNASAYSRHRPRMRSPILVEYEPGEGVVEAGPVEGCLRSA